MTGPVTPEDIFFIDRALAKPLQAQIRETVISGVLAHRLPAGARLPSTRRLAQRLGISRMTVTLAYQELVAQGYVTPAPRSGYVVAENAPPMQAAAEPASPTAGGVDWADKLARPLSGLSAIEKPADWRRFPYPFIYGQMDASLFDLAAWRDCARQALAKRDFEDMAGDAAAADDPLLVNYICARTLPRRGVTVRSDEILVTLGAQNALWLAVQLLAKPGLHAVCENPGYPDLRAALTWSGARITGVDVDREGLPPEALPLDAEAVFVTPSHHAPTAVTLPMGRRRALLAAAEARDFVIVEDDYDFEMSFLAPPSPALKSLDRSGRVIYVGSFSKALFPGLRLGYMAAPAPVIAEARRLRGLMLRHPPGHLQRTAAYFLALGHYDRLIRAMRAVYAERREIAEAALAGEDLEICGAAPFGGANLWLGAPEGVDAAALAAALREKDGVLIEPGAPFFMEPAGPSRFFRLAYSSIATNRIDEGVRRIARRLRAMRRG